MRVCLSVHVESIRAHLKCPVNGMTLERGDVEISFTLYQIRPQYAYLGGLSACQHPHYDSSLAGCRPPVAPLWNGVRYSEVT